MCGFGDFFRPGTVWTKPTSQETPREALGRVLLGLILCYLLPMRITEPVKSGLVVIVLGVATFTSTAIWLKTARTTVADSPISIHPGTVNEEFIADYDAMYVMSVRFDSTISRTR